MAGEVQLLKAASASNISTLCITQYSLTPHVNMAEGVMSLSDLAIDQLAHEIHVDNLFSLPQHLLKKVIEKLRHDKQEL